ncbi:MAG: acetyltransferase [Planctomycetota bacterium]
MSDIIVVGGGGHARVVISILKKLNDYNIIGYTDVKDRGELSGVSFLGCDDVLKEIKKKFPECAAVIGMGMVSADDALKRVEIFQLLKSHCFKMPAVISPDAIVNEDVEIGSGTVIIDGVVINSGTTIGNGAILNTRCSVDHDCEVRDFTHIGPGATLCGSVRVGEGVLVGAGSVVCQNKSIGDNCIIGAGAVVVEDCIDSGTYVGVPVSQVK